MRRYGTPPPGVTVPGRDAGLNLRLRPLEPCPEPEPCVPRVTGLFWFSEASGGFAAPVEAAYLLPDGAAGPVLAVAALTGETCGEPIAWATVWTPETEDGGPPGVYEDGARLIVYPLADTAPGLLEVVATHRRQSYGPILLSVLRYECAPGYGYESPFTVCLVWNNGLTHVDL